MHSTSVHVSVRVVEVCDVMSHTEGAFGAGGEGGGLGGEQTSSVPSADTMYQSPPTPASAPPGPR